MAYTSTAPEYINFSNEQTMAIIQFEDDKLLGKLPELVLLKVWMHASLGRVTFPGNGVL